MTDTEILNRTIALLRMYCEHGLVVSPRRARAWLDEIYCDRHPLRRVDDGVPLTETTVYVTP